LLKPGINFKEWDENWRQYTGKKLIELGLITTADETSIAKYYPHYSHFLGLDVHDAGDYSRAFEPGMVLTCEPGIYIPEEAIGVRIEDDVLITENGCKVLSGKLPRTLTTLTDSG
jgi:Xaa-Pro aminopeptidase